MLTGEDEGEVRDFPTASASPTLAPWGHASFILAPLWALTLGASWSGPGAQTFLAS